MVFSFIGIISATPGVFIFRQFLRLGSILVLGVALAFIGNTLMGLCPLFGIPQDIRFVCVGLAVLGFSLTLLGVPLLPYIVLYYEKHPQYLKGIGDLTTEDQSHEITDKAAGMLTFSIGAAELVGPATGRAIYEQIGYKWTFSLISGVILVIGMLFILWGGAFEK